MLLRGSNTRGTRAQSQNRARSSRGRGATSRGASHSSSATIDGNSSNTFEKERLENAAKREQRGSQNRGVSNGRGTRTSALGAHHNNQVRFTDNQTGDKEIQLNTPPAASSSPFGAPSTTIFNPFAPTPIQDAQRNGFDTPAVSTSPFGAPSQPSASIFGKPQVSLLESSSTSGLQKPPSSVFGAPSTPFPNSPFSRTPPSSNGIHHTSNGLRPFSIQPIANPFGGSSDRLAAISSDGVPSQAASTSPPAPTFGTFKSTAMANGFLPTFNTPTSTTPIPSPSLNAMPTSSSALAEKMDKLLEKEGISRPIWPTSTPGDPKQKGAVEAFWQTSKVYRGNVRTALIRAGLLDDPDKPKKLSEAIDFKGTCEDMCPEFEKITRIMEHDVQGPEKEAAPDGSLWPSPPKMVKALARSAAGQDAPLPMDVRSPAALRRTLDYLMHTVLGDDGNLPSVHGFLWDRTRAIRRDFVFQSSMNPSELADQVYCLERITRFHVIALHRMSRDDVVAEDFSEQQEIEQLGKALLSLIHAYEDCNAQSIHCENEAEFRAYYVLFNSHNTGILETVQDWGWRFWGESDQIRIAVSLVEALQNTWDSRGPLKPHSAIDIAQNAYSRFFSIVEDKQVSYTMACFAEIHFNTVRKSALKTILASYRKQRDQTKDWTLAKLNAYLWFDDEENIISFGESYGLQFGEIDDEVYLSFELGDAISDPFPPLKQQHSYSLVERKRGDNSLPAVIDKTVFERGDTEKHVGFDEISSWNTNGQGEGELELFVKDNDRENGVGAGVFLSESTPVNGDDKQPKEQQLAPIQDAHLDSTSQLKAFSKPASSSLFDNIAAPPKRFGVDFFTHKVAEKSSLGQRGTSEPLASASTKAQAKSPPFTLTSTLTPSSGTTVSTSPSSFVPQTPIRPSTESPKTSLSLGSYTISASPVPGVGAKPQFSFGDYAGTSPNGVPAIGIAQPNEVHFGSPREQHVTPPTKKSQLPYSGSLSSAAPDTTFVPLSSNPQIQAQTPKHTSAPQISSLLPSHEHKLSHASPSSTPQTPTFTNRKEKFSKFCEWFATGEHGLVDQFTAFSVEQILKNATRIYMNAEAERRAKEADALAREEADQFRYRALAAKYGRMWRDAAHRKWLRRRGREARRARQEMAENLRASKTVQSANIVEDFKASTNARRNSLESLLDATGVLNGVHDSNEKIRAIVQDEMKKVGAGPLRRRSERSTNSPSSSTSNIKRGNSDNPLRRSLMSDPSYLNGGSRIHLMSHYGSQDEERRHVSGVQTDYFRLKARGITTLPNGTPLASSVAHTALHKKRSFEYNRPITPELSVQLTVPRSAPTNNIHRGIPRGTTEREDDIQALKARAKAIIADEERSRRTEKKRSLDEGEDEELFARAKRIREQMDEGAQWFRNEIERSRSIS